MAINFDSLPTDNPFALPDPGIYLAKIVDAEMKQGKDLAKPPYLNLRLMLTDAAGNNKGSVYDILAESESSVVQYKISRFVRACGIPLTGSMELSDLAKIVKGKDIAVDITHDNSSDRPRAQVDLFSREAYYLPSEFAEIKELVSPPLGELNDFGPVDAGDVPFNAPDGGAPAQDNKPVY